MVKRWYRAARMPTKAPMETTESAVLTTEPVAEDPLDDPEEPSEDPEEPWEDPDEPSEEPLVSGFDLLGAALTPTVTTASSVVLSA